MRLTKNKFFWALYLFLVYELVMIVFRLSGFSLEKLFLTSFLWIIVLLEFITLFTKFTEIKQSLQRTAFNAFFLLILWNLFGIARSIIAGTEKIYTLFGNINTTLMLLIPLSLVFALDIKSIHVISRYLFRILAIGAIISVLIITKSDFFVIDQSIMNFLVLAILLMLLLYYYSYWIKIYIIIITFLVFIDAWFLESRAMMIRIPLFLICLTAIIIYRKLKSRSVLFLSFVVVFLPFIWFYTSINDNQSLFARYSEEVFNTQDNRTFLYTEVFDDLLKTKTIIQGKGASGTYYSPTMRIAKVDSKNRPNVEVGILAILLKGGIIAVFLTSILIIYAIYLAFFKTNNIYTIAIGYLLLIHFVILFVENLVQFNTYNFLIWYFIGICLNGQVREMTDQEIFNLVKYGEPA